MDNKNFEDVSFSIVAKDIKLFPRSIVVIDDTQQQYLIFYRSSELEIVIHKLQNYNDDKELSHLRMSNRLCTVPHRGVASDEDLLNEFSKYMGEGYG